jgi:hypothetical protein
VEDVLAVLQKNVDRSKKVISEAARMIGEAPEEIHCEGVMANAIMTSKDRITADARRRLEVLLGRYM